jgi:hypothetical protein
MKLKPVPYVRQPRGYWYYLDGEHVCVNDQPRTRSQLPLTARHILGPYTERAFVLSAADNVARVIVETA